MATGKTRRPNRRKISWDYVSMMTEAVTAISLNFSEMVPLLTVLDVSPRLSYTGRAVASRRLEKLVLAVRRRDALEKSGVLRDYYRMAQGEKSEKAFPSHTRRHAKECLEKGVKTWRTASTVHNFLWIRLVDNWSVAKKLRRRWESRSFYSFMMNTGGENHRMIWENFN